MLLIIYILINMLAPNLLSWAGFWCMVTVCAPFLVNIIYMFRPSHEQRGFHEQSGPFVNGLVGLLN